MAFTTCAQCRGTIAAQAETCPYCGAAVAGQPPAPPPVLRTPAPVPAPATDAPSRTALFVAAGCAGGVVLLDLLGRFGMEFVYRFCGWQLIWLLKLGLAVTAGVIALTQATRAK